MGSVAPIRQRALSAFSYASTGLALKRRACSVFYAGAKLPHSRNARFAACGPFNFFRKGKAMSRYIIMTFGGAALALAVAGAAAQNAPAPTPPNAVGVTPAEAAEAARRAIPRSDTATVVRTAPSPLERARPSAQNNTTSTTSAAGNGPSAVGNLEPSAVGPSAPAEVSPATSVDAAPPAPPVSPVRAARRSPRADRN